MNAFQELWWHQAKSDHALYETLRRTGVEQCHTLHYMQMATEKLAKAFFWRTGSAPSKSHAGFVKFLRILGAVSGSQRDRVASLFAFSRFTDFQNWLRTVLPLAYDLERTTPDLANDGPNPEYPWPHLQPNTAPVQYQFPVWSSLHFGKGRDLMRMIRTAVIRFPEIADL